MYIYIFIFTFTFIRTYANRSKHRKENKKEGEPSRSSLSRASFCISSTHEICPEAGPSIFLNPEACPSENLTSLEFRPAVSYRTARGGSVTQI